MFSERKCYSTSGVLHSWFIATGLTVQDMDGDHVTGLLGDLLLAGVVSGVDCVSPLLEKLIARLKSVVAKMGALVPAGVYLPAPPLYCPQPVRDTEVSGWEGKKFVASSSFCG